MCALSHAWELSQCSQYPCRHIIQHEHIISCNSACFTSLCKHLTLTRSITFYAKVLQCCYLPLLSRLVCIGCFDGTDCCGSAWGQCVCWTPRWNGCCHGVTDPTCLAQNAACYALKEPLQAALQVAEVVVDQSRHVLDVANAALEAAKVQAVIAKGVLDGVVATLEGVKQTFHTGLEAANVIASVGLGGVINIEKLEFDVLLSAAATGYFSGSVTASFGGQPSTTVSINVDLYDVTAMARQLADHVVSGLSTLF